MNWELLNGQIDSGNIIPVFGDRVVDIIISTEEFNDYEQNDIFKFSYLNSRNIRINLFDYLSLRLINIYEPTINRPYKNSNILQEISKTADFDELEEVTKRIISYLKPENFSYDTVEQIFNCGKFSQFVWATSAPLYTKQNGYVSHQFQLPVNESILNGENSEKTVFKIFGTIAETQYAKDDEQKLDFINAMQNSGKFFANSFYKSVKDKNFLFIGTDFSNWFKRFFVGIISGVQYKRSDNAKTIIDTSLFENRIFIYASENYSMKFLEPNPEFFADTETFIAELKAHCF